MLTYLMYAVVTVTYELVEILYREPTYIHTIYVNKVDKQFTYALHVVDRYANSTFHKYLRYKQINNSWEYLVGRVQRLYRPMPYIELLLHPLYVDVIKLSK